MKTEKKTSLKSKASRFNTTMQRVVGVLCAVASTAGLLFAQGWSGSSHLPTFDSKRPPPLTLVQAYAIAEKRIGTATNRFYCVTASCLDPTNRVSTGWVFEVSNTNGDRAIIKVLFNSEVSIDERSAALLK
jgi:hypothetical protein